ncbi:MAG: minor extracellular serine protease Vpr [Gaiellaceae bacterium]|nr:minor extracellular serine protease Vpr [Gaiellaceae bacterium]
MVDAHGSGPCARKGVEVQVLSSALLRLVIPILAAAAAAVVLTGDGLGAPGAGPPVELVVTLKAPALSSFGRSLQSASHAAYLRQIDAAQNTLARRVIAAVPGAQIRWRYRLVANGFAVVVPSGAAGELAKIPGVAAVWPNVRYHASASLGGPEQIGADKLWGPTFATAGNGMKIAIIDDGLDATNPYFNPSGFQYPTGFPKGQTKYATPKVIVQRTFAPPSPTWKYANTPFDPTESFHATHVAGIAAGDHGTAAGGTLISGVAPNAYLGNYKALTIPTPSFGLDGNSAELAAAVEAAVADGMNVINMSLGEPEVNPSRDLLVTALEGAAAAGVVPVIAAGNDFSDFGYGSVSSPGSAPSAITVAAADSRNVIASFSSAGPTPMSLQMKPDVSAPGVAILSSLPASQGTFGELSGTSMAAPHVAGAAALLKQRHPTWTVAQLKSALEQSGDPVLSATGSEVLASREGGGMIDLPRADTPLIFAAPTGLSFGVLAPGATATRSVELTDAGGGAGDWAVTTLVQQGSGTLAVAPTITVPGTLSVTATAGPNASDVTGFVVLTRGADSRRIPLWFAVSAPKLAGERKTTLAKAGTYKGTTTGAPSLITTYRYPTGGDVQYPGPERAYRVTVTGRPANFGVVVLSGRAVPHVTFDGSEERLAGYVGLPLDLNPYRKSYGASVPIAGVDVPSAGPYDIVFDTRSAAQAGPFTFRYWVNDVTPPKLRVTVKKRTIVVAATDAGSGVDPSSFTVSVGGRAVATHGKAGVTINATKGRHKVVVRASDFQEAKNMENVPPILPNTATLTVTAVVR